MEVLDNSIVISDKNSWESKAYLQELFKSIPAKNILKIQYQKADGTSSERKLEPVGCYHQSNNWYLIAFCQLKKDYRTFKLNRIVKLQVLDQCFETEHISLQNYIDRQEDDWKERQQFYSIEIAFNQSFVKFAEGRKYYFGFVEQTTVNDAVHMKFLNSSIEIIARWLLQFGDQATVIAPVELKDRMKTLATQIYRHYH